MGINSNGMNMENADLSPTEWREKFITFLEDDLNIYGKSLDDKVIESLEKEYSDHEDNDDDNVDDDDDDDEDDDDDDDADDDEEDIDGDYEEDTDTDDDDDNAEDRAAHDKYKRQRKAHSHLRMIRMGPLFASQPRLKKICKDRNNQVFSSSFTRYTFWDNEHDSVVRIHEKTNDLKYFLNLCGFNVTNLDVSTYPTSEIMPIINANCPKLWDLALGFKEIMSQDFENCFSNMPKLRLLSIYWKCTEILPITLAKSLEQIGETLEVLKLSCSLQGNDLFSPDSLAPVFPRLITLDRLKIWKFGLSQLLLQSISEMKNLSQLELTSRWPKNHPMFDTRISMYPIGNMKNLWCLRIDCDYGVRDEFLINLSNNAKRLTILDIHGINITDIGMSAINNLEKLQDFDLGLTFSFFDPRSAKNEFITDKSIQCLFNQELETLNISNCINITDKSVIKLVENLPNLTDLSIKNTKVTREAVEEIYKLEKQREEPLKVHHSFKNND